MRVVQSRPCEGLPASGLHIGDVGLVGVLEAFSAHVEGEALALLLRAPEGLIGVAGRIDPANDLVLLGDYIQFDGCHGRIFLV